MTTPDIGDYCRRVEDHLTRANEGHLVRIAGPAFELLRGWAEAGIPLSIVFRGIDQKAERYREGRARRPLRLEFCEGDVLTVYDQWRRAVGVFGQDHAEAPHGGDEPASGEHVAEESRRPSLSRHLDRAIDRLSRAMGRQDWPAGLRDACEPILQDLAELKRSATRARGEAREAAVAQLAPLEARLAAILRTFAPAPMQTAARADAEADLAPYRARLSADAWSQSLEVSVDRLLRDRLGLPSLTL